MILAGVIIVLLAITGYLVRVHHLQNAHSVPQIAREARPQVQESYFTAGLRSGVIAQESFAQAAVFMGQYVYGDKQLIHSLLVGLLSGGHVMIQGQPGTGKTTAARMLSRACDLSYSRIQCTSDLLPQDVIGTEVFDATTQSFHVHVGPINANIVHVDEINRATPKLQSAFLEAMQEQAVTLSNQKIDLPTPFFVVATQNPYDGIGTYLLPYAQIDRFMLSVTLSPLTAGEEYALLQHADQLTVGLSLPEGKSVVSAAAVAQAMREVRDVVIEDKHIQYALSIVHTIKKYGIPLSTRASKSLLIAAKSRAYLQGKHIVESVDIDAVIIPVLGHRVSHSTGGEVSVSALYHMVTGVAGKDDIVGS